MIFTPLDFLKVNYKVDIVKGFESGSNCPESKKKAVFEVKAGL
jgi:hypothetical protein